VEIIAWTKQGTPLFPVDIGMTMIQVTNYPSDEEVAISVDRRVIKLETVETVRPRYYLYLHFAW